MRIDIRTNLKDFESALDDLQRTQLPYATMLALNATAEDCKTDLRSSMLRVFNNPVPYTLNSLAIERASKQDLTASVYLKDFAGKGTPAPNYLLPQIEGGGRKQKRSERLLAPFMGSARYWVPGGGAKLNSAGNMTGGQITSLLSQLGSSSDRMQNQSKASRKRAGKRRQQHFVPSPGSRLAPGVWKREGRSVKPVLIFVDHVNYKARWPWQQIVETTAAREMPPNLVQAMEKAMATAFRRVAA